MTNFPKSEIEEQLLPTRPVHECWLKLGRETCNMFKWTWYCYDILQWKYGKSHKVSQSFHSLFDFFVIIKGGLDSYLLAAYARADEEEFLKTLRAYTDGPRYTTDVFYNIGNIEEPKLETHKSMRFSKTLSSEENAYITEYQSRLKKYIEYLKFVEPYLAKVGFVQCETHRTFPKSIEKLKKLSEKISSLCNV